MMLWLRIFPRLLRKLVIDVRIRHAYDQDRERCFAPSGSRFANKNSIVVDHDGNRSIKTTGQTDRYAYIQSFRDSVDLHQILQRCAVNGDYSELMKAQGSFGDFVGIPGDLRSLENLRMSAEDSYNALSPEIKAKMSLEDFLECFSTQEKFDGLQSLLAPTTPKEEVIDVEQKQ